MAALAPDGETPVPNIMIAVMGATGTGKSTFIHNLTGDDSIHIGHGQESQTDQVEVSAYFDPDNNCYVTLVDTPGFDDSRSGVSDTDILQKIVEFLQHNGGQKLNGLVYMHRISDPRMGGISKRNLRTFKQLCGEGALKNVCIATTNWGRVTKEEGDTREQELRESPNLFKPLVDQGAQLARHDRGITSARSIVNYFIHKDPTKLQIQVELDAGLTLEETSTGAVLQEEIIALKAKHEAELRALKEEIEDAAKERQAELLAELEEERQKMEEQRRKMEQDLENLKAQARSDKAKSEAEMRALEKKMEADAKKRDAELLAERKAREELERKNREHLKLLEEQAQRDKERREAEMRAMAKTLEEEAKKWEAKRRAEAEAHAEQERKNRQQFQALLQEQATRDQEKHAAEMRDLKAKMDADAAKAKAAVAAAERREREEQERKRQEKIRLQEQARREKEKHDAEMRAWKAKMAADAKEKDAALAAERREREEMERQKKQLRKDANRGAVGKFAEGYGEAMGDLVQGGHKNFGPLGALVGAGLGAWIAPLHGAKLALFGR